MKKRKKLPRSFQERGLVVLDFAKLAPQILDTGLADGALARAISINERTMTRVRNSLGIRRNSAKKIADYFQRSLSSLVLNHDHRESVAGPEWRVESELAGPLQASNGLEFWIYRMRHQFLPETWARGKCFFLRKLAEDEQARIRAQLVRHPTICRRFRGSPFIPINLATYPENGSRAWWVIDEWIAGRDLATVLQSGPVPLRDLPRLMRAIAEGLRVLHDARILRRELSPRNILLRDSDGSVVLTDFELGKLTDGGLTVSASWPDDPYRAPEVGSSAQLDARADLYSWGRIFVHAALGQLPDPGQEGSRLQGVPLPRRVRNLVLQCVAQPSTDRPPRIEAVLQALSGWE